MICLSNKNNPVGVETQIGLFILIYLLILFTIFWRSRRHRRAGRLIKSAFG